MENNTTIPSELESLNDEIAKLFRRRLEILDGSASTRVDPAHERALLARVTEGLGPAAENAARRLFATLLDIDRAHFRSAEGHDDAVLADVKAAAAAPKPFANRAMVACVGTEGAYGQKATSLLFSFPTIFYLDKRSSVFEAVGRGLFTYGVLPVENTVSGAVAAVYDLLVRHHCRIVRTIRLKVDHVLLALPGVKLEDVREVTSHPHALAQCGEFLRAHAAIHTAVGANTAVAAKELAASGRRDAAVIASRECAEIYGLAVLAENIADDPANYTRFMCIGRDLEVHPDANKFGVQFTLPHRPGMLAGFLSRFAALDINLTQLDSHPAPGTDLEYRFTLELEASPTDARVLALLAEIAGNPEVRNFTVLGVYAAK
ncbi:MAG: prephenate dehydratase [Kiritimatiellae bacterium]|nr:prephenate dehydratase [Kiritimatiellia bacterium]